MINFFVINLKRRKDRLKKISSHLDSNGLKFIKFEAIDAEKSSYSLLNKNIAQGGGPLGKIPNGDLACFQSHYSLWRHIAKNENNPVLILEDDVRISNLGFKLLNDITWIPKDSKIIKIERFGNNKHRILVSPLLNTRFNFNLHYLLSKHSGTGGYILTPEGAKFLIKKSANVNVSVDHYLFNPNNSNIFSELKPIQILPAICEQMDSSSDIHIHRDKFSLLSFFDVIKELKRGYYEIRLLPKQLYQLLFKNCILIKPKISD